MMHRVAQGSEAPAGPQFSIWLRLEPRSPQIRRAKEVKKWRTDLHLCWRSRTREAAVTNRKDSNRMEVQAAAVLVSLREQPSWIRTSSNSSTCSHIHLRDVTDHILWNTESRQGERGTGEDPPVPVPDRSRSLNQSCLRKVIFYTLQLLLAGEVL